MLNPAAVRRPSQLLPSALAWAGVALLVAGFAMQALPAARSTQRLPGAGA